MTGKNKSTLTLDSRGQISIMTAMMFTTFIFLFMFVVNTGMLVNAKINLQNAADMAAYAGAAVQARQLNHIGHLNYEMRRQYKKFLFRYYVVGNMSYPTFFEQNSGAREWKPNSDADDVQVPVLCLTFFHRDNHCQNPVLQGLAIPPANPLNQISTTAALQHRRLEELRIQNCNRIGEIHRMLLAFWLFNTDPQLTTIDGVLEQSLPPEEKQAYGRIKGLARGMGVVPSLALLMARIKTLDYYVNFPAQKTVNFSKAQAISEEGDVAARERTLQAYFSAYNTLGEHTFTDSDSIVMDELLPQRLMQLETIRTGFEAYYLHYPEVQNVVLQPDVPVDCKAVPHPVPLRDIPVGVYKDPQALTFYAVRLKAPAQLLFNPFGDTITLKAYAAAQPFGSRIGPRLSGTDFRSPDQVAKLVNPPPDSDLFSQCADKCQGIPNLPVKEDDSSAMGWNDAGVQLQMFSAITRFVGNNLTNLDATTMERAYRLVMLPNPWEAGQYNIMNDYGTPDPFIQNFDEQGMGAIWAPIVSSDQLGEGGVEAAISQMLNEAFQGLGGPQTSTTPNQLANALRTGIMQYLGQLRSGKGHDGDGFNVARLQDPLRYFDESTGGLERIELGPDVTLSGANNIKSGWAATRDGTLNQIGRTGYSVKFVSFKNLLSGAGTSDGTTGWTNAGEMDLDVEAESDIENLQH